MKTLIITSCSSSKKIKVSDKKYKLTPCDFDDEEKKKEKEERISKYHNEYILPAYEMYTGRFYGNDETDCFKKGYEEFKNRYGDDFVDVYILSAGYGLIEPTKEICPYDVSYIYSEFKKIKVLGYKTKKEWGDKLNSRSDLNKLIKEKEYDLILLYLSNDYLEALGIPNDKLVVKEGARVIFFNKEPVEAEEKEEESKTAKGTAEEAKEESVNVTNMCTFLTNEDNLMKYNRKKTGKKASASSFRGYIAYEIFKLAIEKGDSSDPFKIIYENYNKLEDEIIK